MGQASRNFTAYLPPPHRPIFDEKYQDERTLDFYRLHHRLVRVAGLDSSKVRNLDVNGGSLCAEFGAKKEIRRERTDQRPGRGNGR